MRFLVTGGAGLIGSNIVSNLLQRGYNVTVIDNLQAYPFNYHSFFGTQPLNIDFKKGDIRDAAFLDGIFNASEKFDVVIHAAAYADVGACVINYDEDFTNNIMGTYNVLKYSKKYNAGKVVFVSSASVYGNNSRSAFKEGDPLEPVSTYGNSKLWGENQTILFGKLYGMKTTSIRYFSVYGSPQVPKINSHSWCVAIFAMMGSTGKPITIYGDGNQVRDFVHVKDIAEGTVIASLTDKCNGEIINIGFGRPVTINKVADLVFSHIKCCGVTTKPYPKGDPIGGYADICKMKSLLSWSPSIDIEDGVHEYCDWFTRNFSYLRDIGYTKSF